jgi:hypothetical protein
MVITDVTYSLDKFYDVSDGRAERGLEISALTVIDVPQKAELIVISSTRLNAYDLATGTSRWWLPLASDGSIGTQLAHGDTLLVSTLGSSEPMLPTFAATLAKYNKDKDGRLSLEEFRSDEMAEHFG